MHTYSYKHFLSYLSLLALLLINGAPSSANEIELPELGDSTSAIVSPQQEYQLGRSWLRMFRSQVKTVSDPLLHDYLEHLIYQLATHSQLKDRRLELVVVDNASLNAFAVPGGVVGVHTGMLLYAKTEDQLAAVLSHELAHLSQRHFARSVEEAQRNALPNMAALLASLVIAATTGGDAGIAALSAVQAASIQSQLSFSRANEQEADRVGMDTMLSSGMNPYAVGDMFEEMQRAARYAGNRPPEFLLTHPVTESRIADARNRAVQFPRRADNNNFDYHLMQARVKAAMAETPMHAVKNFRSEVSRGGKQVNAAYYGLAIALIDSGQYQDANEIINDLLKDKPNKIAYIIAKAEALAIGHQWEPAKTLLKKHLSLNPGNHPLTMSYAEILLKAGNITAAETVLNKHVASNPHDPHLWFLLAETHGLAGNIVGVHQARAEYFILNGILDQAQKQLHYALGLTKDDFRLRARIQNRIREIEVMKKRVDL